MHRPRVVLLHALMALATIWAQENPVTKKVASIGVTPGIASWTSFGRFVRGEEIEERAIPISQISVSTFKRLSKWLSSKVDKFTQSRASRFSQERLEDFFLEKYLEARVDEDPFSPTVYSWVARIDIFNNDNPKYKISPGKLLARAINGLALARKIEAGLLTPDDQELATILAKGQIECWKIGGRSAMDVFRLLELDKPGLNIFERPELNTWYHYVRIHDNNEEKAKQKMASVLAKSFTVDELDDALEHATLSEDERSQQTFLKLASAVYRHQNL